MHHNAAVRGGCRLCASFGMHIVRPPAHDAGVVLSILSSFAWVQQHVPMCVALERVMHGPLHKTQAIYGTKDVQSC